MYRFVAAMGLLVILRRPNARELALNDVKLEDARQRATKSLETRREFENFEMPIPSNPIHLILEKPCDTFVGACHPPKEALQAKLRASRAEPSHSEVGHEKIRERMMTMMTIISIVRK